MKKSTRLLALLLCVVMMATLLPTFALADVGTTVVDNKGVGKDIFTLSQDRYTINENPGYTDSGYGYDTTYFFPRSETSAKKTITINRVAEDYNRWWRWAADNTVYNQRKTNSEVGYDPNAAKFDTHYSTTAAGERVNIDDWTATIQYTYNRKTREVPVPRSNERTGHLYILSKPLLSPRPCCFYWRGGNTDFAQTVIVTIERCKPLGTHSILWSANGTSEDQGAAYVKLNLAFSADPNEFNGLNKDRYVYYGDMGQNHMIIVEPRTVTYNLDGGNIGGDVNNQQYVVWTTGTASTSQKHKVIQTIPEKYGYSFQGWWCEELSKFVTPGADLNNGITEDMHLTARWKEKVANPDYQVSFNGNGNTNTDVHMPNQELRFDTTETVEPTNVRNLDRNQYVREFTVTFNANKGITPVNSAVASAEFMGWEDRGDLNGYSYTQFDAPYYANTYGDLYAAFGYDKVDLLNHYINNGIGEGRSATGSPRGTYPDEAPVSDLTNIKDAVVPLYAQWKDGSVTLPTPHREPNPDDTDDKNVLSYTFNGWYTAETGGTRVGGAGDTYTPTANVTLYAQWTAVKETKFWIKHVQNGVVVKTDEDNVNKDGDNPKIVNMPGKTTSGYLYGGTFTEQACLNVATNDPTNFVPEAGQTYYIWEVTNEHLQPLTLSTWANVTGGYDVTHVYLLTAIDRLQYSEAGFYIDDVQTKVPGKDNDVAYDKVGVQVGGTTIPMTYIQLNPLAKTTDGSKVVCYELEGFQSGSHTMQPYWVTLDGWEVKGQNIRTITYNGVGKEYSNKLITVEDSAQLYFAPTPAKSVRNAPMMLMSCFNPSQSTPVTVPEPKMLNVVDGENAYEVEITNDLALTPAGQDGKLFIGWYTDEAYTKIADLNNVEDGDTVYAKYVSAEYMQVKYSFGLITKTLSLTSAVDSKDYAETGYVISTKNGDDKVVVSKYATTFALQNANKLFGVEKNAPLMNVDYKLGGLSKNDTVTVTPYLVTADGTTVYGAARTLTYTGLTMKG